VVLTILPEQQRCAAAKDRQAAETGRQAVPFVGGDIAESTYEQISDILQRQQNFSLAGYKDLCIKRRIAARIRAVGMHDPALYIELLAADQTEQQKLLAALSIHVSQFFRNRSTYALLEKTVLPELLQRARAQRSKLRIWSIGCANGEEPYSLAMLCLKLSGADDLLSIIGSDLSPDALQRAKRGCYPANRLAEVGTEDRQNYFIQQDDQYCVTEPVKQAVRFFRHDILSDQPFYRADLILCRNVLIYFTRLQQQRILRILAAALPQGGYLVLGRAETLVTSCRDLFRCVDPAERIYQRLDTDAPLLPTALVQQLQDS
jgi:chemotaxis protein methyltransferase CheR